ncbi:transmembrane protein 176B [Hippocampus comes]|uniref:Membrane spanning 4-domains A18 n=1 Tax=Hippocampus comes TaxID=109280 RepID=A0A3Q3DE31_HIPCM|nr:PREDICTED: membrane-spanning 4-domains subfamily A member 18 [Hippocampus comes]XP_019727458.1 PREDICTED: membrane-spanning 4-domains subfamily A member 18 [Hippocampus comes]
MSVTMTKADGVTMLTLTSNPKSSWPPLCQILGGLCYSPMCCSVSRHLRTIMGTSQSVLGALHIMVGLLNIGLGAILMATGPASSWQMDSTAFPHWLGALFILFGTISIFSEKFPSPCLVLLNALLNLSGISFAIAGIVLYAINASRIYVWNICRDDDNDDYYWSRRRATTPSPSSAEQYYQERCSEGRELILMLLKAINGIAIVLCVLELCLVISSCVLAFKSLCHPSSAQQDNQQQSRDDPEGGYKPLLEEVEA